MARPPIITIPDDDADDEPIEVKEEFIILAEMQSSWGATVYLNCGTYSDQEKATADADIIENRDGKTTHVVVFIPRKHAPKIPLVNI